MVVTDILELKKISEPVSLEEGKEIARKLIVNLALHRGMGLSAPQIRIHKRVCIVDVPVNEYHKPFQCELINPKITERDDEVICRGEGCLSFPGQYVNTKRSGQITVVDDLHPAGLVFIGLGAQVVQHEVDHLDGIVMFDRRVDMTVKNTQQKVGRNDPCPCGSGKKYKKCCDKV